LYEKFAGKMLMKLTQDVVVSMMIIRSVVFETCCDMERMFFPKESSNSMKSNTLPTLAWLLGCTAECFTDLGKLNLLMLAQF